MATEAKPIFRAVSTSPRPLYQLLRCIDFAQKVHVQITESGIRFSADSSRVMQGVAVLEKSLFTAYTVNFPLSEDGETSIYPDFQIPLSTFLEVLQIFGSVDVAARAQKADQDTYRSNIRNYKPDAFSNHTLGIPGTCTLLYAKMGDKFKIIMEEAGIKTTAALTTYLPEMPEDIPFNRHDPAFKIIMPSRTLFDCIAEIIPAGPVKLAITATKSSPFLTFSCVADIGSSSVEFTRGKDLLETFLVNDRWSQAYKFDFIRHASEAMRIASKVSIRGDAQGVLSLQFMVDVEGGKKSFLDFRFVPFATHDDGDEEEDDDDDFEAEDYD